LWAIISSMRLHGSRMWPTAALAASAAGLLSGCGIPGPHSLVTTCVTGEVLGFKGEPGVALGNFYAFPSRYRTERSGPGLTVGSAFEFTVTNDTGGTAQVNGLTVVTYSGSGTAIGYFSLSPGPATNGDLLGSDMQPGQKYQSDAISDRAITGASGRFDESATCKVVVNWSNPGGPDQY
jgi:hypothetical protein